VRRELEAQVSHCPLLTVITVFEEGARGAGVVVPVAVKCRYGRRPLSAVKGLEAQVLRRRITAYSPLLLVRGPLSYIAYHLIPVTFDK